MYLDTNILIYLLEQHKDYSERIAKILQELADNNGQLITSVITVTEFLAGTESSSLVTLQKVPRLEFVQLTEGLAEKAARLQKKENLQIGDAIQLATAIEQGAGSFFTNDKQLARIVKNYMEIVQL
jgi:predicted nucleic acid-binding protein